MRIFLLVLIVATFFLGCDKLPWIHPKKENVSKDSKSKAAVKSKPKEIKTTQDIQMALTNAGYYKGPINGKTSSALEQAIKRFQKNNGLAPDGEVGKKTRVKLRKFLK
jgi:peptidoglycan hydrolase-like protein with peptidoglycan-binding domain